MSDYPNEEGKRLLAKTAVDHMAIAKSLLEEAGLVPKTEYAIPKWAIVFNTNGAGTRGKRWYHVSRIIETDGKTWELYWHPDLSTRGRSIKEVFRAAQAAGVKLAPGVYCDAMSPRIGSELVRTS